MKKVTIKVADERPDNISVKEYDQAKKLGPLEVNAVTALQNVRLSKGLYQIVPEKVDQEATLNFNGTPISEMGRALLFQAAMTLGITIAKKNIETAKLRQLVQDKFQAFVDGAPEEVADEE